MGNHAEQVQSIGLPWVVSHDLSVNSLRRVQVASLVALDRNCESLLNRFQGLLLAYRSSRRGIGILPVTIRKKMTGWKPILRCIRLARGLVYDISS
jgi:hypothetical protein